MKVEDATSDPIVTNTGSPQGCVLSALLFTLCTNDWQSHSDKCKLFKYADDTVLLGLLNKKRLNDDCSEYVNEIALFHNWCKLNFQDLNLSKTKEKIC